MDLSAMKAKIAAGVLPSANGVVGHHVRFGSGVCVGCNAALAGDAHGSVEFEVDRVKHSLHLDCYVMWSEACAD